MNMMPIKVETWKVFDTLILDITIGASSIISLTVPEAIDLIRKINEKL